MARLTTEDEDLVNNVILQKEELEALSAIYGDDFLLENDNKEDWMRFEDTDKSNDQTLLSAMPTFNICIRAENAVDEIPNSGVANSEARLIVSFQPGYPTTCPPIYQLSIPWLRGGQKQLIADALEELYLEHLGESIVYIWVEKVRELLHEEFSTNLRIPAAAVKESVQTANQVDATTATGDCNNAAVAAVDPVTSRKLIDHFSNSLSFNLPSGDGCVDDGRTSSFGDLYEPSWQVVDRNKAQHQANSLGRVPPIQTGAPLTDRKSTFQAHVAPVNDTGEIRLVLEELNLNKKIAAATHNMYAYRILRDDSKTWFQDCDDDGETHAGSRLLHLLQILDCRNVIVVVSRWYGGIQLHADRFKHINNVARQALVEFGYVSSTDGKKMDDSKAKKSSTRK